MAQPQWNLSHFNGHYIEWGSIPAWFGGLSFLAAFYIIARDKARNVREQALLVTCWIDRVEYEGELESPEEEPAPYHRVIVGDERNYDRRPYKLRVQNQSNSPIFHIVVNQIPLTDEEVSSERRRTGRQTISKLNHTTEPSETFAFYAPLPRGGPQNPDVIRPGDFAETVVKMRKWPMYYQVKVNFRDSAGLGWSRDVHTGVLRRDRAHDAGNQQVLLLTQIKAKRAIRKVLHPRNCED